MTGEGHPLIIFVRDMERLNVAPFRYEDGRLWPLACRLRDAAIADDAQTVAHLIRSTRLERLWRIEKWLTNPKRLRRHLRIAKWLRAQLHQPDRVTKRRSQ